MYDYYWYNKKNTSQNKEEMQTISWDNYEWRPKKEVIRITVVGKQYNVGYFGIDFLQIPLALYLLPNYALSYF